MTELPKGMVCSGVIHGIVLGLFLLVGGRLAAVGNNSRELDLILAQNPSPLRDKPPGPTEAGDPPPPSAADPAAADDAAADDAAADDAAPSPGRPQLSTSGPEILKRQKAQQQAERAERLAKIRQGLRKTPAKARASIQPPSVANISASELEKRINSRVSNAKVATRVGGGGGTPGAAQDGALSARGDPFMAALSAELHRAWEQPRRSEVGRGNPVVGVSIVLRADGTVTAFQITRSSGNAAMDRSVERLFRQHRQLPAPAAYGASEAVRTIQVTFELDPAGDA